jgi:hypothetical protein
VTQPLLIACCPLPSAPFSLSRSPLRRPCRDFVGSSSRYSSRAHSSILNCGLGLKTHVRSPIPRYELEGWGWFGHSQKDVVPYTSFLKFFDRSPTSGVNAHLDVWLQFGLIGQLALLVLTFLGLWLLASLERSFVYSWLPLVLVAFLITSLTESVILLKSNGLPWWSAV